VHYVYVLQSLAHPTQRYIGYTADLRARLAAHNTGDCRHTSKFLPWRLACYHAFPDKQRALDFERYLKSHSGSAFGAKRLWGGRTKTVPTGRI
jgi:putative endonuclease